jgi:glycerol uptake facilitator protein
MGWLAVALGFGLSFGVVITMLGYISAHLNPATCLALWVIGDVRSCKGTLSMLATCKHPGRPPPPPALSDPPSPCPPPPPRQISFTHFLALSGAEFAGALVGACLVFLHYLPHFKTVPEPMAADVDDMLLRRWGCTSGPRDLVSTVPLALPLVLVTPSLAGRCWPRLGVAGGLGHACLIS